MTAQPPTTGRGFMDDMSPQTQARRARQSKTPWRNGPMCDSPNAGKSFKRYQSKGKKA